MSSVPPFWQLCLDAFRAELTPQQFNTWIRPLAVEGGAEGYRVLAPNRFVLQWVRERFAGRIAELAVDADGQPLPVTLGATESAPPAPETPAPAHELHGVEVPGRQMKAEWAPGTAEQAAEKVHSKYLRG